MRDPKFIDEGASRFDLDQGALGLFLFSFSAFICYYCHFLCHMMGANGHVFPLFACLSRIKLAFVTALL